MSIGFVPPDIMSQLRATEPEDCPYCQAHPAIPCVAHAGLKDFVLTNTVPPRPLEREDVEAYEASLHEAEAMEQIIDRIEDKRARRGVEW